MTIRCLLVDDEHFALALLEKFIGNTPGLKVVAACKAPFAPSRFCKVSRLTDRVRRLDGDALLLDGEARIPVARARKRAVTEALFSQETPPPTPT